MLSPEAGIAFAITSFLLIVVPGPSVLFVIGRSLTLGRRGGLLTVVGNELGGIPLIAAVALGIGTIVSESILMFMAIKIAGAAYLVFLGVQAIRHRHVHSHLGEESPPPVQGLRILLQGFFIGVTNPKSIVFFVAVLPQFVDYHRDGVPGQIMVLGLIFTAVAFICDSLWALTAGSARTWFTRSPQRMTRMTMAGGGMIIGLGGILLLTGNKR